MALPETDLHRIRIWARERVPEHLWDQIKVEADVSDRHVDIVEVRPPWDGSRRAHPVPDRTTALHQVERPLGDLLARPPPQVHEYKRKRPTKNVQALVDHIGGSGDPIFWG